MLFAALSPFFLKRKETEGRRESGSAAGGTCRSVRREGKKKKRRREGGGSGTPLTDGHRTHATQTAKCGQRVKSESSGGGVLSDLYCAQSILPCKQTISGLGNLEKKPSRECNDHEITSCGSDEDDDAHLWNSIELGSDRCPSTVPNPALMTTSVEHHYLQN